MTEECQTLFQFQDDVAKTITVQFSTADEVFVEINDPKNGSFFNNLAPTFSWTTGESNVTVSVYEALPTQRSPQDALTGGNPCLVRYGDRLKHHSLILPMLNVSSHKTNHTFSKYRR